MSLLRTHTLTHSHRVGLQLKPPSSNRSYHDNGRQGCVCACFKSGRCLLGGGVEAICPLGRGQQSRLQAEQTCRIRACQVDVRRKNFISQHFKPQTSSLVFNQDWIYRFAQVTPFHWVVTSLGTPYKHPVWHSCAYIHPENTWRLKSDICNNHMCL